MSLPTVMQTMTEIEELVHATSKTCLQTLFNTCILF